MECLDDNTISAYLARRLSGTEQQRVVAHLSSCDLCLTIACASLPEDTAPGPMLGPYRILADLGGGSYLAHDPQLGRDVALKRGERAAAVRHPNVLPVLATVEVEGEVLVALELFGEPLATWLATPRSWQELVRAFVAAGRGALAAGRGFVADEVFIDAAGRVAVTPVGDGVASDLAASLRAALGADVPWRVRAALRAPMPVLLDRLERALRPRRPVVPVVAVAVIAAALLAAIAWSRAGDPEGAPAPIAAVATTIAQQRRTIEMAEAFAAGNYARALELARATGDRRAQILAELGNDQLVDAIRDGSALVAETGAPPADAVRALVAAHALLGHGELARGTLDRLSPEDRARAAADLAIYEARRDPAPAPPLAANLALEARWPGDHGPWLAHERRARAAFAAGDRGLALRELRWCLDHRGQGALLSIALLADVERALR